MRVGGLDTHHQMGEGVAALAIFSEDMELGWVGYLQGHRCKLRTCLQVSIPRVYTFAAESGAFRYARDLFGTGSLRGPSEAEHA